MRILDNHMHLSPTGQGVDAARLFEKAGGTALILTHMPYRDVRIASASDYKTAFQKTLDMAEAVRKSTSLKVFVAVGPYPVELIRLADSVGLRKAVEIQKEAMGLAGDLAVEGEVVAIGEVGRPHFPVERSIIEACNDVLRHGMAVAKEAGCAIVLHTESPTPATYEEFARMADSVNLPREKVVKHFSPPFINEAENHGLMPSVLARDDFIRQALEKGGRFLLETDFIDDPRRPGAVLGPSTVPKKTKALIEKGVMTEEIASEVHEEWPRRIYGIET